MIDRVHRFAERVWAFIAILALGLSIYDIATRGWEGGRSSLLFPAIAGAWYVTRRGVRQKVESSANKEEDHLA